MVAAAVGWLACGASPPFVCVETTTVAIMRPATTAIRNGRPGTLASFVD